MLFWLFLILIAICIGCFIILEHISFKHDCTEIFTACVAAIPGVVGCTGLIISVIIFAMNYFGLEGNIAEYKERYNTIVFEVENKLYDDDVTTTSRRELVKEIQNWNCDLVKGKKIQHNFWIGVYIPDIYDDFEFIPLEKILKEDDMKNEIIQMR